VQTGVSVRRAVKTTSGRSSAHLACCAGLEITKQLSASESNQVFAACRTASEELKAVPNVAAIIENIDVGSSDVGKTLFGSLAGQAPFHVVINNAGILKDANILEVQDEDMMQHFNVNSVGPIRVTQALLNAGLVAGDAKLIYVSSILGSMGDRPAGGLYSYRMSKAALNMAVATMANELTTLAEQDKVPKGLIVSTVHPGWVATDMGSAKAPVQPTDAAASIIKHTQELTAAASGHFVDMTTGKDLPW